MGEQSRLLEGARMLSFLVALALVAVASGNACKGKPTGLSLITDAPELVSQTANGKLYAVKTIEPNLLVAHVYGTGKARGLSLAAEFLEDPSLLQYVEQRRAKLDAQKAKLEATRHRRSHAGGKSKKKTRARGKRR